MFLQRLITSLILVPVVLGLLFYAPFGVLVGIALVIYLAMAKECLQLIPINKVIPQIAFFAALLLALWACGYVFHYWLSIGLIVWLMACIAIITFPKSQSYWGYPAIVTGIFLLFLPLFLQSLGRLYHEPQGKGLVLYVLFLIWASDIGAYLTGKMWGAHKMIPKVSPGKSWEGVLGGVGLAMLVASMGFFYFAPHSAILWFVLALLTVIISIFGDLFISILKRRCHLKDTGAIIPGHGGILDRLDSLIAALPLFYWGLKCF